jgi:hypothetical protein
MSVGIPAIVVINMGARCTAPNIATYVVDSTKLSLVLEPPISGSFQSSIATSVALELSSRGTWNTRHPGTYFFSPQERCSPTRAESSRFGYNVTAPAQNHAFPAWDDREKGLTRNDMLSGGDGNFWEAIICKRRCTKYDGDSVSARTSPITR